MCECDLLSIPIRPSRVKEEKKGDWGKQTDFLGLYCEVLMHFLEYYVVSYSQNKT